MAFMRPIIFRSACTCYVFRIRVREHERWTVVDSQTSHAQSDLGLVNDLLQRHLLQQTSIYIANKNLPWHIISGEITAMTSHGVDCKSRSRYIHANRANQDADPQYMNYRMCAAIAQHRDAVKRVR